MLTTRQARIYDRLPKMGAIVTVHTHPLQPGRRFRRLRVESYPALFGVGRMWERHLVTLRALDDSRQTYTVSGFYCQEEAA